MGSWRQDRTVSVLRAALKAAVLATATATPLAAGPIATVASGAEVPLPADYAVLDIRDEDTCFQSAPARTRCLPAAQLLYSNAGAPLSFHALRWALGALGLKGDETLVIYAGETGARDDALAAAALVYLTGQAEVLVHDGPALEVGDGAQLRALWREVIYTAPMRTRDMEVTTAPAGRLRDRLKDYAAGGGVVAFASGH